MKRIVSIILLAVLVIFALSVCAQDEAFLEERCEQLRAEIAALKEEKASINSEISKAKEENGTAVYVVTFRIKQSHFTLDIGEHIKDSMNEITFEVAVDKEYYDSVSVGETINNDFRVGSLIMHGSFGNWKVTVDNKEVR